MCLHRFFMISEITKDKNLSSDLGSIFLSNTSKVGSFRENSDSIACQLNFLIQLLESLSKEG